MRKHIPLFLLLFFITVTARAQLFTTEELEILKLKDQRTYGPNNELFTYLDNFNDAVVIRALLAIGNIGKEEGVRYAAEMLFSNRSVDIRVSAAYSLGLLPYEDSRNALLEAITTLKDESVIAEVLNSIGFIGTQENLEQISALNYTDDILKSAQAMSIARFARRNIKSSNAVSRLIELSQSVNASVLKSVSYALNNMRNRDLLMPAKNVIASLMNNENSDVRMWAAVANGYVSDSGHDIIARYSSENTWQVKVNLLNSLQTISKFNPELSAGKDLAMFLINKGQGEDVYLAVTALKVLGNIFKSSSESLKSDILPNLQWFLQEGKAVDIPVIAEALNTIGMIYKDKAKEELISFYNASEGYDLKSAVISSFKYFDDVAIYNTMRDMITKDVQAYVDKNKIESGDMIAGKELNSLYRSFIESLAELKYKANNKDKLTMRLIFSEFVSSKDPSIVDLCLASLSDSLYLSDRPETKTILALDYSELQYPKDKEAMRLLLRAMGDLKADNFIDILKKELNSSDYEIAKESADALKKITDKDFTFTAKRKYENPNKISELTGSETVTLKTTKGYIKLKLYPYFAPYSVLNFINLVNTGFYNNTVFHRVIPNFVIQGGDPLNNGWGGPEYSIRSEFSPLHFERGILGMASDGKDTEGSQFFIMHSPFYHLDNNYTIFGEVLEGMDVVDKIYIGDVLEKVVISGSKNQ